MATPRSARFVIDITAIAVATTKSATGRPGKSRSPKTSSAIATTPNVSTTPFVSPNWPNKVDNRSKKWSPPPGTPKSFGSCVSAIVSAAPALKPTRIVSLMKFTNPLKRRIQASALNAATTSAVSAAIAAQRAGSPFAMPATVVPTSMAIAEVGPIASWRDVPKSTYPRPPTR